MGRTPHALIVCETTGSDTLTEVPVGLIVIRSPPERPFRAGR